MRQKFLQLLNIRPEESWLARQLFLVQFFLVMGSSFLLVTAYAVFLANYPIIELPGAYLISGIFLLAGNLAYTRMEHRTDIKQLLYAIILFCTAITAAVWAGMQYTSWKFMPYALFIWNNIVYMLASLVFWGLAAMLFNVRESKRLFTIIGAGDIPAKLLGYLAVSLLVPFIGLKNMILVSLLAFGIAYLFSRRLFAGDRINIGHLHRQAHRQEVQHRPNAPRGRKIFRSGLIASISWLSLLTFMVLTLVDFVFLSEVKIKYHTDVEIAYFFGIFFAFGRILALILKVTLSSRMISRLGLMGSLLLSPLILLAVAVFIIFASGAGISLREFLYLFGILSLLTEILKSVIQEPIFLVLFQPLKLNQRLRGHVIAKGYMNALALILAGAFLVGYLERVKHPSIVLFSYILAGAILCWIAVIYLVRKAYVKTLHEALKSGFFRGNELFLNDHDTIDLLIQKTHSEKSMEVMYALDLLGKSDYEKMDELLRHQLERKDPLLIKYALEKITAHGDESAIPAIEELLNGTADSRIRALCIEAIGELYKDSDDKLGPWLDAADNGCKQAAVEGLLKSGDLNSIVLAGRQLLLLMASPHEAERVMASVIIGNTGVKNFYRTLTGLLEDKSPHVQREAIAAAGKIKNEKLLPVLVDKLQHKSTAKASMRALANYGDAALDYYAARAEREMQPGALLPSFICIAGNIRSTRAVDFLIKNLFDYPDQGKQIIESLWERGYEADATAGKQFMILIRAELGHAAQIIRYIHEVKQYQKAGILYWALVTEINISAEKIFKLLSFIRDRHKINGAMNALLILKEDFRSSNAFEMLEMMLPKDIFQQLNAVLDFMHHADAEHKMKGQKEGLGVILKNIIREKAGMFNQWTRAVAISLIPQTGEPGMMDFLRGFPGENEPAIIKETRMYVLSGVNS